MDDRELENIIGMLDGMIEKDVSRFKITTSEELEEGQVERAYHHGRCDINSPWARGCSFDVLEEEE